MGFYDVLDQVVDLLRRRGRVTYRALKREFQLDDAFLEDLKDEIIKAQHLAVDEQGDVLVWTGGAGADPAPSALTPTLQHEPSERQATAAVVSPATPHPAEAERRQLTVLFCDLVDSTKLSGQLDPEEYREVVRAYQQTCTQVIQRFDGYVAQYLGDGLLVYFGYPAAHEDDAQRAVRTGLGILEAIGTLNPQLEHEKGIRLSVRLGMHTGLVVIGAMGGAGRQEQLALGDVPNIAARLEGLAQPDTVVVSHATYRLTHGYFDCDALGEQTLRGMAEPMAVYRVRSTSGAQSRLDIAAPRGLTPLVGRASEVTLLLERWAHAKEGQGQVVVLSGEAGIGKSRLVHVLKDHVTSEPHTRLECRSLPYYQHSPLYPIIELFPRLLSWQHDASPDEKLPQLAHALSQYRLPVEEAIPLLAPLLSLSIPEDRYPPLTFSPQRQRQKTFEVILAMLLELSAQRPVLFILEDLHWTDPSTLELLALLMDQIPTVSLCAILTCRPTFQPTWSSRSYVTQVTLSRLSPHPVVQMAEHVAGEKRLPAEVLRHIVEKTDGVPLFVEEMTKAVLESGVLQEVNGQYEMTGSLAAFAIPATLHDSLMARLDRLGTAKAVAQYAAVLGRHFSYALLHAVAQVDEPTLQRELGRLVDAELLYQRGLPPQATYLFKHALIRDIAYESLLRSTRQGYHQRVVQVLEAQFPETAATQPELLAHHCTEAGLNAQAVRYWHQAGQHAIQRSAHAEAVAHLTQGLAVLTILPHTPERSRQELALQTSLGPALMAVRGYGAEEVEHAYRRARELSQEVNDTAEQVRALMGLYVVFFVRASHEAATALAGELLQLGQAFLEAGREIGLPVIEDNNAAEMEGVSHFNLTIKNGKRHSVARAYLYPAMERPNLTVLMYAETRRLVCEGTRCRGVEYTLQGEVKTTRAVREIVLCAGAIGSPRVLLLSGIGPAEDLKRLGIPVVVNLPGVGRNLQDHVLLAGIQYEVQGDLPAPKNNGGESTMWWKSDPKLLCPDIQSVIAEFPFATAELAAQVPPNCYTIAPGLVRPASRGQVKLTSSEPTADLEIDMNYLERDADVQALLCAIDMCRDMGASAAFKEWRKREVMPGKRDKAGMLEFLRMSTSSFFHPTSTCKMGSDDMAVVDPQLSVYGVSGLRVADASIMPTVTTGNTNAPTVLIGEKAAEMMLS